MHSRLIVGAVLVGVGGCLEFVGERGGPRMRYRSGMKWVGILRPGFARSLGAHAQVPSGGGPMLVSDVIGDCQPCAVRKELRGLLDQRLGPRDLTEDEQGGGATNPMLSSLAAWSAAFAAATSSPGECRRSGTATRFSGRFSSANRAERGSCSGVTGASVLGVRRMFGMLGPFGSGGLAGARPASRSAQ